MKAFLKSLSLAPRGLRHKLVISFSLMAIIPMLVCGYLVIHYVFPTIQNFRDVTLVFLITLFIMLLGFYLARQIILPVIKITLKAKGIANGDLTEMLDVTSEDEIGQLSGSLNQLSMRLKDNMSELHSYGEKIKRINMEINKKVFALSSLLQISNLITSSSNIDEVLALIVDKLAQLGPEGAAFLMFVDAKAGELNVRAQSNIVPELTEEFRLKVGRGLVGKAFETSQTIIMDSKQKPKGAAEEVRKILPKTNIIILPITSSGRIIGLLGFGNNEENFFFSDEERELINVFAKQVAVAVENDMLVRKTEQLTVRDELTGLYNENFIRSRMDEEIKRAVVYQRPCAFVVLKVDNFSYYRDVLGAAGVEKILKKVAQILKSNTSEIDKVARFGHGRFALILPEKNKNQVSSLVENIKNEVARYEFRENKLKEGVSLILNTAISATPVDGTSASELINRAMSQLEEKGNNTNKREESDNDK